MDNSKRIQKLRNRVTKVIGDNAPSTFLVPLEQRRIKSIDCDDEFIITMVLVSDENIFPPIHISPAEIENRKCLYKYGAKNVPTVNEDSWDLIRKVYDVLKDSIPERVVYNFVGYSKAENKFIFGCHIISPYNIIVADNAAVKGEMKIDYNVSTKFFLTKYISCFNNRTVGMIVLLTLLESFMLSRLGDLSNERPAYVLALIGKTGSFKTSVAQATLMPFGDAHFCVSSFEDTPASVVATIKQSRDCVSHVDDFYTNTDKNMALILEKCIRLSGDASTSGKKMSGGKIDTGKNESMVVMTGEQTPKVRVSSIPRMLVISMDNSINRDALTVLQNSQPQLRGALAKFIQFTLKDVDFTSSVLSKFKAHRQRVIQTETPDWHPRYTSTYCWLLTFFEIFCEFCMSEGVEFDSIKTIPNDLHKFILEQHRQYMEHDDKYIFLSTLKRLMNYGKLSIGYAQRIGSDDIYYDIIFDGPCLLIESTEVISKIRTHCTENGILFDADRIPLYESLVHDGYAQRYKGNITYRFRRKHVNESVFCLNWNNCIRFLQGGEI